VKHYLVSQHYRFRYDSDLPLHLVSPVRCTHLALADVLSVPSLEGLLPSLLALRGGVRAGPAHALLTKPNQLHVVPLLSENGVVLLRVVGRALWLVVPAELLAVPCVLRVCHAKSLAQDTISVQVGNEVIFTRLLIIGLYIYLYLTINEVYIS
jgi:hypothetical protein